MFHSLTLVALCAGLATGGPFNGKPYPTHGVKNPNPADAKILAKAVPLNSDGENHTLQRTGQAYCTSRIAHPGVTPQYCGYYVGGGCILRCNSGPPGPCRGTWGLDYCRNWFFRHRVKLGWCSRKRYKGGSGSYRTEDPIEIPNVFEFHLPERPEYHPDYAHENGQESCGGKAASRGH